MPMAARYSGGRSSITNDPFWAPGSTPSSVWGSADGDCFNSAFLVRPTWTSRKTKKLWQKPPKESWTTGSLPVS